MWGLFDHSAFFHWLLSSSLKSSVLVLLILLIKFFLKDRICTRVGLTLTGNGGVDKTFSPKGRLLGLVGTSGTYYALDNPESLEQAYAGMLEYKQQRAKETGVFFQPGVITSYPEILIDINEKNFSSIIYQDETGKKFTIPVTGISPVFSGQA